MYEDDKTDTLEIIMIAEKYHKYMYRYSHSNGKT